MATIVQMKTAQSKTETKAKPFRQARKLPTKTQVMLELWNTVRQTTTDREKIAGIQALLRHMPDDTGTDNGSALRDELKQALSNGFSTENAKKS